MGSMRLATLRRAVTRATGSPLAWILAGALVLRVVGIGWGLPSSDGWDNDGVAPRDFLAGLVETVTPGHFYTYPPVHLVVLAVVTAPVTILALLRAPSLAAPDVVAEILKVPTMTTIAYGARLVSLAMSLGIVWAVAKMAEELRGPRAGWCAAAFVGVNVPLTYYAHTTNLDVPYLFWGCMALLVLVRCVARREPRLLRRWALLAALAVGTKDQAYALFLVAAPVGLGLWLALDPWARRSARTLLREAAIATGIGLGLLVVIDGVLLNPTGFRERVRFLLGPASQGYAHYTDDWLGRWDVVRDLTTGFDLHYPWAFAALAVLGVAVLVGAERRDGARLVAALLPLLAALSFTVAFNCVARRTDQRFSLPQTVLAAVYGGVAVDALLFRVRLPAARWLASLSVAAAFAVALFAAADVDANMLLDPRYEAEAWLRAHAGPTDTVETYGLNVYMPRFPPGVRVIRVGPDASDHRNPMPGVEEVVDAYGNATARGAKYIVVSEGWVWRYLIDPREFPSRGRMLPPTQRETGNDEAATAYFRALTWSEYGRYRIAHVAGWASKTWPRLEIHASLAREIWIYERVD
ncbi:MAG TPA: glycosyltransferase family 39 protein [Polyangiaceae bacterium]|jgi:4-amino-4-deoxy-L-arabinose transferase-like glycosyltransferase